MDWCLLGGDLLGGLVGGGGVFSVGETAAFCDGGEVWGVTFPPSGLAVCKSLKAIAMPAFADPGPLVTRVRSRTVAKVDSIGFVVFR